MKKKTKKKLNSAGPGYTYRTVCVVIYIWSCHCGTADGAGGVVSQPSGDAVLVERVGAPRQKAARLAALVLRPADHAQVPH